ncbi:MAG TPA: hypothetical protein VJV22_08835 [Acidobacteriaceae bacterium]|nr:hypothetical protein [Acidobacteriaceae bacterium]
MSETVQVFIGIAILAAIFLGIGYLIGRSSRKANQILDDTITRRRLGVLPQPRHHRPADSDRKAENQIRDTRPFPVAARN